MKKARTWKGFPPVALRNLQTDEDFERIVALQRQQTLELADQVEAGEIGPHDRQFIAAILRAWANLPKTRRRRPGRQPTMDPGTVALLFAMLVKEDGFTQERAYGELANRYGVTEEGVKNAIKPHKERLLAWFDEQK